MKFSIGAIIVCAGKGRRLGGLDKALVKLKGKPLFFYAFGAFRKFKEIKQIVLVFRKSSLNRARGLVKDSNVIFVKGGKERKDSVFNGLKALRADIRYVLIHDGARPLVSPKIIRSVLAGLKKYPAVVSAIRVSDTVKSVSKGFVRQTLNRDDIFLAQTPQGFKKDLLLKAYQKFKGRDLTDDALGIELLGKKVKVVEGSRDNIKITYPEDIGLAKRLFCRGRRSAPPTNMKNYKIGFGFDVHQIIKAKKVLVLGGVKIPSPFSLKAVSDGDVVLHAVSDAICGAANLGDIGDYFPAEAKASKNIDSKEIARFILKKVVGRYTIENIDIIIITESPRLVNHKKAITDSLCKILLTSQVNLKIKSKEGLDILGTKDSMSCLATALLRKT